MAKKKAQDFGEWYSGSEERDKAVNAAASSHASKKQSEQAQDFADWYTEGEGQSYNTLRFVANDVAKTNATRRYYPYNNNNISSRLSDGGDMAMGRYERAYQDWTKINQAVENYNAWVARENNEPYNGTGDASKGPKSMRFLESQNEEWTQNAYRSQGINDRNRSDMLPDGGDKAQARRDRTYDAIQNYNAWVAQQNGEPYTGYGDPSKGMKALPYLERLGEQWSRDTYQSQGISDVNRRYDLPDGGDRAQERYELAQQDWEKTNQAIEDYNAWVAQRNGEQYDGPGNASNGPKALLYLQNREQQYRDDSYQSQGIIGANRNYMEPDGGDRTRAAFDEFMQAMQRANQMRAADYAINEILGRTEEPGTAMVHYSKYDDMSAAEIMDEWNRYKERTASDLKDARMLLNMTFAGVSGTGYEDIRNRLSSYYGIDAYDADSLQELVDDLTNGKVYLPDGTTTTYSALYSNASSKLPQKDIDEITRLKSMSSADIQKQYESQDYTDHDTLQQDKNTVDFLLQNADTMRDYPEGSWEYEARQRISEEYGVDPKDEQALQDLSVRLGIKLINNPKAVNPEVAYTDSNGTSYMWRDLYYEAENREQFGKMGQDEEALKLMTNGYALMRRMNFYNQGVVDPETAVTAMNINNELMPQLNAIKEQLAGMGYDFNRMAEYLDTDEAKQDYLMQLEANASYAQEHPWFASLYSVLLMPITSLEGLMDVVGGIGSGGINTPIEEYVPLNYYDNYATNARDTMRGAVQQEIYNDLLAYTGDEKVAKLGQSLYSGTMSVADSRMSLALCSALFSPLGEVFGESFGQGFVKWASLIMMGTSAAGEEFKQQIESGNDNTGTIMMAIAAGMNEVLFEQLSLDKLLEGKEIASWDWDNVSGSVKKIMKQSFIQRGIEGSEEVFTSLANMFAARLTGNSDQYKKEYDSLVSSREVSPSEANRVVTEHFFKDLFMEDFFGGFIAGGGELNYIKGAVMNTRAAQNVADAYGNYQQNRAYRNIGAGVVQNQNVSELVRTGQQSENEAVRNLANQVAENRVYQQPAEKPSKKQQRAYNIDVGKLTTEVVKENAKTAFHGDEAVVKEVIRDELKNRNIKPEDYVVDVIAQVYNNGEESLTKYGKSIAENVNASEIAEAVKGRADEIEAEASKRSDEAFDRLKNVQSMVQTDVSDRVSDTGEVIDTRTGKAVEIGEFVKDGDNITLTTKDGGRVRTADLQFANPTQAVLYDQVQAAGLSPEVANSVIKAFDGQGTNAANIYVQGMLEGMAYGRTYQTPDMDLKGPFFAELTPAQKDLAVKLGTWERSVDLDMAKESVRKLRESVTGNVRTGSVTGITSKDTGLNNAQRTGIRAIEMLVDNGVLKNNFHFFQSEAQGTKRVVSAEVAEELGLDNPNNDKYVSAPNGFYDPKTGDIYIDVNAGNAGQGTVLFTTAHELTHFVKQWSPDKFQDLASFLVEQYHGAGVNVDSLVRDQQQKGAKRNLSYDEAFEEMVADSMQTMFTDGNLATKLMALKERDKTLFDKMVDFVKKLQTGINKVYARFDPEGQEGKALAQIKGAIDNLADMFAEGITEATESYTLANAKNLSEADIKKLDSMGFTVANGLIVAKNMADIANRVVPPGRLDIYSYRTEPEWEKSVIAQWGDNEDTRRYINAVKAFTNAMVADDAVKRLVPMGSYAYETYGPLRDNQEYIYTFDMDTSCPRTFQFIKYRDVIQAYAKRPLTYNESVNLLELMRAFGQNIPCSYCYVENKRVLLSASYNNFFAFRNNVLNEQDSEKAKAQMYGYNEKNGTLAKASQEVFDRWRRDMSYNPTVSDIWEATQTARNSVFNFLDEQLKNGVITTKQAQKKTENFVCDHFGVKGQGPRAEISGIVSEWIYDTHAQQKHTYFLQNNPDVDRVDVRALGLNHEALAYAKSASSAKTVSSYVPYTDQLKNIPQKVKDYVMGMGGIRKHSSNDFRIDYVQDYFMFYADLAAGGWTGHTYTKSTDFVKIFGNTGDRINMSIAMLDGPNGTVRENTLEGMYWKDAKALRNAYKNAGVMSMVTSDAQLSYALNSDWIDMVIPFHASSLDKKVWYDLRHWFDYTTKQLERFYNSTEMELALIQKALDDAGVKYSSDQMNADLIAAAKEAGAGGKSDERTKIMTKEVKRLKSLAAKNGVQFNPKMSTTEIQDLYNSTFGIKQAYGKNGNRIKPHFLPGETVVDGVTIPGHNNDVNKYLELCREYGVHPRFDGVVVQDANGKDVNVIDHDGYIKLIKETARTDSAQEKIQFNFDQYDEYLKMTPMEYAMQQLQDYARIGGYDNLSEDPMGIKKRFIDEYLGQDREIGWFSEDTQDKIDLLNEYQNKENTGDVDELPKYKGNDNDASGYSYSIREIVDEFGTNYGKGVYLDSTRLDGKDDATRKSEIQSIVGNLGGQIVSAFDKDGNKVDFTIVDSTYFADRKGHNSHANRDLKTYLRGNKVKQESILLINEIATTSSRFVTSNSRYTHGWLDNNGDGTWEVWKTYVEDRDGDIWRVGLRIAVAEDGTRYLYDLIPDKEKVGRSVDSLTIPQTHNTTSPVESQEDNGGKLIMSFRDRGEDITRGAYINNSGFDYRNEIESLRKKGETRFKKNSLLENAYKNNWRIALVESGTGNSEAYATTRIGRPEWISANDWEKRRKDTRVPKGSVYDLKQGESGKWYYPFVDLHVLTKPVKQTANSAYGAKFSARDSEGNTLSLEQQEYFKDSQVRDEDGNLRVVYHGTDANFTVFDPTKGRSTMDIQGMFFSPWEIDAAGYGSNVQAYYLNITNPAPEGLAYKALNLYKGQNDAGVKARNYLEKKGYDGVNNGDEEYIAFRPEQAKLVENAKPTSNPDIRYSDRDISELQNDVVRNPIYQRANERRAALWDQYQKLQEELRKIPSSLPESQWTDSDREMVNLLGRSYKPHNPEWSAKYDEAQKVYKNFERAVSHLNNMILNNEPAARWADLGDLTPAMQDEYEGFRKNDTGTSMDTRGSVLVEMSPAEYLRRTAAMFNEVDGRKTNLTMQIRGLNRDSINKIKDAIRSGEKMYTPWLDERGHNGQEGRHRAAAAYELGVDKIPVVYWTRGESRKYSTRGTVDTETSDGEEVRFSIRTEPAPKNTKTAYKLMRLVDGHLYPLFIGNNERVDVGTWYDADSPNLSMLTSLPPGTHLINMETGEAITYAQYAREHVPEKNGKRRTKPNVEDIHWANENGFRFMHIEDKAGTSSATRMQKQYGDTRAYYNWGVNGNASSSTGEGSASLYALRPGWHFGEVPSMHQIGYGDNKDIRLDNQVWVEVEMSADVDYNAEAASNYSGDIPTHIPTNGYYTYATNPTQKKTKGGVTEADRTKADWYVAGAFKPVRIISDAEADRIVNEYNSRTGAKVPLDHRRANGRMFNADTMNLEGGLKLSDRDPDSLDTRTLLSNALLDTAQNDLERKYIADYQAKIQQMNEEQNRLNEIRAEIKDLSFTKGPRDTKHLKALREEANKLANRINIYDKQLLRMESMKTMQAVVNREKQRVETRIKNQMAARMTDYRNKVASREYITRIEHEVKGLRDRLLHPKAKTVIPEAFARPVADFLSGIDFSTFYKDGTRRPGKANITRDKLRMSLEVLSNSLDENTLREEYWMLDISPDMKQWIDNLTHSFDQMATGETFVLNQMSPEDLKNLYKTVVAIRAAVNMAGKLYTNMSSNVQDLALSTIDHLKPLSRKKHSAAGETLYKTLGWDYAQPVTAFERFGDGGKQIFNGLMKGQKQEAIDVQRIRDFADDAYTRDEVESWQDDLKEVEIGENTYNIPATYIMELYCMMKDKDAARHIVEGGGIRFDDLTTGRAGRKTTERFEDTFITDDEVKAMIGTLTDRQKEVADSIQEFMDRVGADWGNEISMTRYGYHAFGQIENYYPIKTVKQGSEYEAQQKRANIYALLNKSFTKERSENANNAVIIGDIFKTFSNHMSEMAVYHSWALPVIDTIKWFNYRESQDVDNEKSEVSVKNALRTAYGRHADEYIRRLLESINSQKSGGLSETLAFKNLRMVNRVAVAGNIRVAIQQPFSMTRAFEMLNPKYVRPMTLKTLKAEYAEMVENSSFGRWKGMGYYDVDISRPLEAEILKNTTFADRFTEKTMKPAEWGDQFTWATLWHGCKLEAEANGLTGEDAVKAAAEKFDQLIVHTQVVDSVLTKSQWMRSDSFWHRMTSAFMSEPMTSYNTLLRRFDQYQRDVAEHGRQYAVSHNWRNIAKTAVVFTLTQAVNALVTAPIDASRDDDDYKTWLEKMLEKFKKSFAENMIPTNMMPYIADIVDYMIYGSEDRADLAMYTRIIDAGKQLYNLFDQDKFTVKKAHRAFMTTLTLISSVTGLPMSNMTRDVIAMWNTVIGDVLNVDYGAWKFQTAKDTNKAGYEQFVKNLKDGNEPRMSYIYSQMLSNDVDEDTVYDGVKDVLRGEYGSDATREETIERLTKAIEFFEGEDGMEYEAEKVISWWDYMNEHPDEDTRTLNWSAYESYYEKAAPYGISLEQYEQYYTQKKEYSKKEDILPIINVQPLTVEQKDALYRMNGSWSENKLGAAPWHQ